MDSTLVNLFCKGYSDTFTNTRRLKNKRYYWRDVFLSQAPQSSPYLIAWIHLGLLLLGERLISIDQFPYFQQLDYILNNPKISPRTRPIYRIIRKRGIQI
jgi:hypothetical protein